jgi:translation initiation factor IF-2
MARSRSGTRGRRGPRKPPRRDGAFGTTAVQVADPRERGAVELPATITVKELAELLGVNPADVIRELIKSGIFATINQLIDRDTASLVSSELGYEVAEPVVGGAPAGGEDGVEAPQAATKEALFTEDDEADLVDRAPIVTVMGHVDHGKTSLLDAIRSTTVAAGERGGITQHIGASDVTRGDRRVVFLDTPGHEAFTAMRARGAKVTDIAVVVVAADDGVMPQTLEAIGHAKAAKVPIIIAMNKIDKPDANADRVKTELTEAGIVIEEYGGDTPLVPVSAKTGVGLDDLVDMVLLVADLQELKANPDRSAIGTIVEARMDKARGPVGTVLVQTGTLNVGDIIVVGETFGRVRALEDEHGKRMKKAGPATPAVILGLSDVPQAGDILRVVADEKAARTAVEGRKAELAARGGEGGGRATLEDLYRQIQAGQAKELRIVLKADVSGSLGAITHALGQLPTDEVKLNVLYEGAGEITDNDILLASASNAIVVGFNTSINDTARRAAESEKVDVRLYDIIYQLTDDIEKALHGMLEPELVEVVEGRAEVRKLIKVGHRRLVRHRRPDRPQRQRPAVARRQGPRDRQDRLAAALQGRCPRGPDRLRVRHRPRRHDRHRRRRRHRVLYHPIRQPLPFPHDQLGGRALRGSPLQPTMRALQPAGLAHAPSGALAPVLGCAFASPVGFGETGNEL